MIMPGYDATHDNIDHLPSGGVDAGYTTGTPDIRWTGADWASHPAAVRICQDSAASDATADVLDVERYAATNAQAPGWYKRALGSFQTAARPGQRRPAIYTSADNVTPLVNALIAGGVRSGPGLVVANWNLTEHQAIADVLAASGPFPIVGVQFTSTQYYDIDVWASQWLGNVSGQKPAGGYEHLTNGRDSIGQLAADRHMQPVSWLLLQEKLNAGDAAALAGAAVPPAGLRWWSESP